MLCYEGETPFPSEIKGFAHQRQSAVIEFQINRIIWRIQEHQRVKNVLRKLNSTTVQCIKIDPQSFVNFWFQINTNTSVSTEKVTLPILER